MWLWIVSLIVLIACFIFAYRMIVSSYDFLPADKKFSLGFKKDYSSDDSLRDETLRDLRSKLKSLEGSTSYYEIQFSKFQQRLKVLEESNDFQKGSVQSVDKKDDEEDWKEMYYEENEAKTKLENEIDVLMQKLEDAENNSGELKKNNLELTALRSDYDTRLNDLQSMQDNMGILQRQLEAAAEREKELEQLLLVEINAKKQYSFLETAHTQLKSENEDIRRQLIEMNKKEAEMESRNKHVKELESRVALYEEEKAKMISDLELMVSHNKMFFSNKNS